MDNVIRQRVQDKIDGCVGVEVRVVDASSGKYALTVVASAFSGVKLLDRHRMIQTLFEEELRSGAIHALEINAKPPPPPPPSA